MRAVGLRERAGAKGCVGGLERVVEDTMSKFTPLSSHHHGEEWIESCRCQVRTVHVLLDAGLHTHAECVVPPLRVL